MTDFEHRGSRLVNSENPWRRLGSRTVYSNAWMSVREDRVLRPDGSPGIYGVVEIHPSVGVLAINDNREIALVRQWRYTLGKMSVEIPTGGSGPGETVREAAGRELREETGLTARKWRCLGEIDTSNGLTTEVAHIFFATDLEQGADDQEPGESIELTWVDLDRAVRMATDGEITESVSVAGLLKLHVLELNGELGS
ncbi:NUDIX hydrolase [Amycolatopsis sp. OK19-0408]|uniref:NUDIX hydrolase n=1 Tax=Amycolatopsis iheyensis TaxID=2945988 RepID=A0A9X2NET3_9PSEU|nr:NUDIX hydrolase [Amycolatopsis iheyensis]MCR6487441.1 NUDIX hydrolase [Amycolatopsis iheyensis]